MADYEEDEFEGEFDEKDVLEELDETEQKEQPKPEKQRALDFLTLQHPECRLDYVESVNQKLPLTAYSPDGGIDKNHKSVPYLTQFERTKILGFRANQLAQGARPFVEIPEHITDVLEIARLELEQKRLPFILKRPMPDGTFEYWRLTDLLIL